MRQFKGIVITLNKQDEGNNVADICRESVLSEPTFYKWKLKYGGMTLSEPKRVKQLEEENARLKQILANQSIEIDILKEINSKKW